MADIYKAPRGTVVKSSDTSVSLARVSPPISGNGEILIITGITVQRNQVTQYIKTVDDKIFGYAWGEGPGIINIRGIIFLGGCENAGGSGVDAVNSYYDDNNVYDKVSPVTLSVGGTAFLGYLEKLDLTASMNEFNYAEFILTLSIIKSGA